MLDTSTQAFGRQLREAWPLDETITYLNHGTVGVVPRAVMAEQRRIQDEIERQPARFLLRELSAIRVGGAPGDESSTGPRDLRVFDRLRAAATDVGGRLGVPGRDLGVRRQRDRRCDLRLSIDAP